MKSSESGNDVLDEFLKGMKDSNPRFKLILDYLENMKTNDKGELEYKIKHLEDRNTRLLRSYRILINRNEICSSALGMCARCWGTDSSCDCGGNGGPGSRIPDNDAFNELILPVLKTMGIVISEKQT